MQPGSSEDAEPFIVHVCQLGKICGTSASWQEEPRGSFQDAKHKGTFCPPGDPATKLSFLD